MTRRNISRIVSARRRLSHEVLVRQIRRGPHPTEAKDRRPKKVVRSHPAAAPGGTEAPSPWRHQRSPERPTAAPTHTTGAPTTPRSPASRSPYWAMAAAPPPSPSTATSRPESAGSSAHQSCVSAPLLGAPATADVAMVTVLRCLPARRQGVSGQPSSVDDLSLRWGEGLFEFVAPALHATVVVVPTRCAKCSVLSMVDRGWYLSRNSPT